MSKRNFLATSALVVFLLFLLAAFIPASSQANTGAKPQSCNCPQAKLEDRLQSANHLLKTGRQIDSEYRNFSSRLKHIAERGAEANSEFIALSAQYQAALARYNQHRKEFFEHCQKYHSRTPPQPTAKFFAPVSTSEQKPLKVTAEDKCKELVALENTLGENEKTLTSMISNYELATQKESAAVLAGMWSQAEQLALSNQAQALQFNHMCIKKTSQASSKIHDLITSAQRDGAYGEQQKAFQDYSNNNKLQQELFQRANKHGRFALMILSQLQSMRPPGATSQGPDMPGISGGNLEIESRTLSDEYRQLQVMFEKLRAMQKSFGK